MEDSIFPFSQEFLAARSSNSYTEIKVHWFVILEVMDASMLEIFVLLIAFLGLCCFEFSWCSMHRIVGVEK